MYVDELAAKLEVEHRHLALADEHVARGAVLIEEEKHRLECLVAAGHNADEAQNLLATLRETLDGWRAHRELIIERINRLTDEVVRRSTPGTPGEHP
jgi:uncharacterized protein YigA (DUF484 family)